MNRVALLLPPTALADRWLSRGNERSTTQLTLTRSSSLTDNLSFIPFSSSVTLD
jgi:hypothetical protein